MGPDPYTGHVKIEGRFYNLVPIIKPSEVKGIKQEDLTQGRTERVREVFNLHKQAHALMKTVMEGGNVQELEALKSEASQAQARMASMVVHIQKRIDRLHLGYALAESVDSDSEEEGDPGQGNGEAKDAPMDTDDASSDESSTSESEENPGNQDWDLILELEEWGQMQQGDEEEIVKKLQGTCLMVTRAQSRANGENEEESGQTNEPVDPSTVGAGGGDGGEPGDDNDDRCRECRRWVWWRR